MIKSPFPSQPMGHEYMQIDNSQARAIEKYLQEDSFSILWFVVNCVSGTLLGLLSLVNLVFYGFCNLVFNCFKIVDLVFKIIGSLMSFLRSLLQFNYHLVTQGFTILGKIASAVLLNFQFGCTSLVGLVISFFHFVINLPFSIATLSWYYAGLLRENCQVILLITYDGLCKLSFVVASCGNVISILVQQVARCMTVLAEGFNIVLKECSFAILKILETVSKTSEFVVGLLKILSHNFWLFVYDFTFMAASTTMLLLQHINTGFYSIWLSIKHTLDAIFNLFERLGTFIAMPFSLANIKFLLGSIFALFQNIVHILLETLYFFCGLLQHSINFIKESVLCAASCFIYALSKLTEPSVWIMLLVPTCLLVTCLVREGAIIRRLETLAVQFFQTVCSYFHREQVVVTAQAVQNGDMLNQNRPNDLQNGDNLPQNDVPQDPHLDGQNNPQRANNEEREILVQRRGDHQWRGDFREQEDDKKDTILPPNGPQDDERHLCIVCLDNDRTTVLLPCRHLCLCHDCAVTLQRNDHRHRTCPLCRKQIQEILNVYL